jgi:hypothetical protein
MQCSATTEHHTAYIYLYKYKDDGRDGGSGGGGRKKIEENVNDGDD